MGNFTCRFIENLTKKPFMKNESMCNVSLVIPVYGSEQVLSELVNQINDVMLEISKNFEVILVCDLSPDKSWTVIQNLSEKHPSVRGILLRKNAGQHNALMAGLERATGKIIVTLDDDLQHSPTDIPALISRVEQGYDVVYGKFKTRKHPFWKILGSRFNNTVAGYLMGKPNQLYLSPFRAFQSVIRDELVRYRGPYVYLDGLILSVTRNIDFIEVDHHDSYADNHHYGLKRSISLWLKMATGFSIIPLRISSFLGLLFAAVGLILAIVLMIQKVTSNTIPTAWSSLIATILIIGGVQLLVLGVIGEYLGRVLLTINAQPQYVIAEQVGFKISKTTQS